MRTDNRILSNFNIQFTILKFSELKQFVTEKKFDILGISESWFSSSFHSDSLNVEGTTLIRKDWSGNKSGGVLLQINSNLKPEIIDISEENEHLFVKIKCNNSYFVNDVVYKAADVNYKFFINSLEMC